MRTTDFDFELPPELVAQAPAPQRDQSRLLVLHRESGRVEHRRFRDLLQYLRAGDLLVLNDSSSEQELQQALKHRTALFLRCHRFLMLASVLLVAGTAFLGGAIIRLLLA